MPDKNKPVQKVVFSRKESPKPQCLKLLFNDISVTGSSLQKPFNIYLYEKLGSTNHIKAKIRKAGTGINFI